MLDSLSKWMGMVSSIGAIVITSLVVKYLDDLLDEDNHHPVFNAIKKAGPIYCVLGILVAATLDLPLVFSLFSACYIVGMFSDLEIRLPSGLSGWLEAIIVFGLSCFVVGLRDTLWAVIVVFATQLCDDMMDTEEDLLNQKANLAIQLGIERSIILFLLLIYIALIQKPLLSTLIITTALIVSKVFKKTLKGKENFVEQL